MPRQKITLTLDAAAVAELRRRVGARSLSAVVDQAVAAHLDHLRHLSAIDRWLAAMEREHGPVPKAALDWAEAQIEAWDGSRRKTGRARRAS
jgi:hypothetical protein